MTRMSKGKVRLWWKRPELGVYGDLYNGKASHTERPLTSHPPTDHQKAKTRTL